MTLLWKLGLGAVAIAAAFFLITMYGSARYKQGKADEASVWSQLVVKAEREKLTAYQSGVASVMNADKQYIETVREKVVPITKTIIERSADYAKTDDGAGICLPADRVRELEAFSSGLFATAATDASGTGADLQAYALGQER